MAVPDTPARRHPRRHRVCHPRRAAALRPPHSGTPPIRAAALVSALSPRRRTLPGSPRRRISASP
jgi:hypothetical protein